MGSQTKTGKKKVKFGKVVLWLLLGLAALHLITDGKSTEKLLSLFTGENSGYSSERPSEGSTAADRLPSVPEELWEHVYLNARGCGSCEGFTGDVKMLVVFVNDPECSWTDSEIDEIKNELASTVSRISGDAADWGASLNLSVEYTIATSSVTLARAECNDWVESALDSMGLASGRSANLTLESQYGVSEVPIVFFTNQGGRSMAISNSSGTIGWEYAIIYDDPGAVYHEVSHLFGAKDFYYPEEVQDLSETYLPDSIMINAYSGEMDSLTAYLIGWTDTLSSDALSFLQETSYLTKDYLNEQHSFEIYTGYVTDYRFDNSTYTGYLVDGMRHGEGTQVWDNGDSYTGSFQYGKMHGQGVYSWADGSYYIGTYENGTRNGQGKMCYSDGGIYEGWFVDGMRHGQGTYTWVDGTVYIGDFVQNARTGQGVVTWPDGSSYTGAFQAGSLHGYGTYTWVDGSTWTGTWENDKFIG